MYDKIKMDTFQCSKQIVITRGVASSYDMLASINSALREVDIMLQSDVPFEARLPASILCKSMNKIEREGLENGRAG